MCKRHSKYKNSLANIVGTNVWKIQPKQFVTNIIIQLLNTISSKMTSKSWRLGKVQVYLLANGLHHQNHFSYDTRHRIIDEVNDGVKSWYSVSCINRTNRGKMF